MRVESITKEEQIRNIILERIASGYYRTNEKIKSIRDLAGEFQVSKQTVQQTISNLVVQKILKCEHGRGTFVLPKHEQSAGNKLVGLLMGTNGDLYASLSSAIIRRLEDSGHYPVVLDTSKRSESPEKLLDRLKELINSDPCGIIISGWEDIDYDAISSHLEQIENVVIIVRNHPKYKGDAMQVLTDDAMGHYMGVRHLLELGHRKILVIPSCPTLFSRVVEMLNGCRRAFAEYGIEWSLDQRFISAENEELDNERLTKLFSQPDRPTAVFASMDFLAVRCCWAAVKAGLKIPDDLSVVGYYNTPWSEKMDPSLTSISIKEEEIGRTAVDQLFGSNAASSGRKKKIVIKPELIIRNSTAARI